MIVKKRKEFKLLELDEKQHLFSAGKSTCRETDALNDPFSRLKTISSIKPGI
jgi:hypothetical protein